MTNISLTVGSMHILLQLAVEAKLGDDPGTQLGELRWGCTFVHCRFQGSIFQHVALIPAARQKIFIEITLNHIEGSSIHISNISISTLVLLFPLGRHFPIQNKDFFAFIFTRKVTLRSKTYLHGSCGQTQQKLQNYSNKLKKINGNKIYIPKSLHLHNLAD